MQYGVYAHKQGTQVTVKLPKVNHTGYATVQGTVISYALSYHTGYPLYSIMVQANNKGVTTGLYSGIQHNKVTCKTPPKLAK